MYEKNSFHTHFHKHIFICESVVKVRWFCRICVARNLNKDVMRPLTIEVTKKCDPENQVKSECIAHELDDKIMQQIDALVDYIFFQKIGP